MCMKNKLLNYRFIAAHKASTYAYLYSKFSQLISGRDCYTNMHTDIVIDGFPRCANTYATYAFDLVQKRRLNIAHHIHKQSQFLIARKYNIPGILLIRKPTDCITSLLLRQPRYDPSTLFKGYHFLYNSLKNLNSFIVGDFGNVLNNYGSIIQQVNAKFECNFEVYIKNDANEEKVKEIIYNQDELVGAKDYKQRVAYPNPEREKTSSEVKEILLQKKYYDLNQKCTEVYLYLLQKNQQQ